MVSELSAERRAEIRAWTNHDEASREWSSACVDLLAALEAAEAKRDAALARVERLEAGLREARCWIGNGSGQSPERRGAKCETAGDAFAVIDALLAPEVK